MSEPLTKLGRILERLEKHYGRPKPPVVTDPLELILWENVVYLAKDEKRAAAFAALKKRVGLKPAKILAASDEELMGITRLGGIVPEISAQKLRRIAEIAQRDFGGDLKAVLKKPLREAKKDLQRFPSIGEPGAEKILLFAHSQPVLALDSNGLRVLRRLGFGEENKDYTKSYRSAQEAVKDQLPKGFVGLVRAHQLLRQHGQTLCKRSRPRCDDCPLNRWCPYFLTRPAGGWPQEAS
jgi:endonuclease III